MDSFEPVFLLFCDTFPFHTTSFHFICLCTVSVLENYLLSVKNILPKIKTFFWSFEFINKPARKRSVLLRIYFAQLMFENGRLASNLFSLKFDFFAV